MGTLALVISLQLAAGVVASESGPTPFTLVSTRQPSIMSATMRQTSRSLRRPWRPSPSLSAARECGACGAGAGVCGARVPLEADCTPCPAVCLSSSWAKWTAALSCQCPLGTRAR